MLIWLRFSDKQELSDGNIPAFTLMVPEFNWPVTVIIPVRERLCLSEILIFYAGNCIPAEKIAVCCLIRCAVDRFRREG